MSEEVLRKQAKSKVARNKQARNLMSKAQGLLAQCSGKLTRVKVITFFNEI